jgi:hypothetical protein
VYETGDELGFGYGEGYSGLEVAGVKHLVDRSGSRVF